MEIFNIKLRDWLSIQRRCLEYAIFKRSAMSPRGRQANNLFFSHRNHQSFFSASILLLFFFFTIHLLLPVWWHRKGALLLAGENRRGKGVELRLTLSHGHDGKTTAVGELTSTPAANCRDHSSRRQLGRKIYFNWRQCVFLGFLDVFFKNLLYCIWPPLEAYITARKHWLH